jgi:hypothetical protein
MISPYAFQHSQKIKKEEEEGRSSRHAMMIIGSDMLFSFFNVTKASFASTADIFGASLILA